MGAQGCPTPNKKGHKTRDAARRHEWGILRRKNDPRSWKRLHVYKCKCGLFHVGHGR